MRLYQKIIVGILMAFALVVAGGTVYGMRALDDANSAINHINEEVNRRSSRRDQEVSIADRDPFSILLLGVDSGGLGREEDDEDPARTDSMMVVTVNPKEEESTIVSLERDIMADMLDDGQTFDKLSHAYAYGDKELSMDVVEQLLDIPIDHYATINLQGMTDLIDAVGGIEVNNEIEFTLEGVHVPEGEVELDGEKGLAYARMRKDDPEGNIGRQRRQREVVTKIVDKLVSMDSISNYRNILNAVEENSKTDFSWNDMLDIASNYYPAFENVTQEQLQGQNQMVNGLSYQILGMNELLDIQNQLKRQLELPTNDELEIEPQNEMSHNGFIGNQFYDDTGEQEEEVPEEGSDSQEQEPQVPPENQEEQVPQVPPQQPDDNVPAVPNEQPGYEDPGVGNGMAEGNYW
ncbi:LCP family protein [Tetragenococcus muriaticus]|uniref:Subfamily F2 cell envelope-associated transcriptional attenuator n=2 Tax=Tetragenococcus muriaticus TaxID=64642 RepID=A0A091C3F3_9ENTE|nr:LCP family protein [Tetragenococcus muriaticus]KFN90617.1 subfamily F2 cell envelope-associated transcriptional attenuator [Tetragenococcus muriaticus 3MR10-3]KFN91122.1 subfamily F2 cell envelope-associated transcriptional attenuator [Tetragenococcus muriaticus PMC-11-5]GMA46956.1 LytR family transcriptional regulator [Tetragenococcus muriaticus]